MSLISAHATKGTNNAPQNLWKATGSGWANMFTLHCKNYLCIVNYHSKFSYNQEDGRSIGRQPNTSM